MEKQPTSFKSDGPSDNTRFYDPNVHYSHTINVRMKALVDEYLRPKSNKDTK